MRIHFTVSDLARTRLASAPSPLAAAAFSDFRLRVSPGPPALDLWRRAVRRNWTPERPGLFGALAVASPAQPLPRFLRPTEGLPSLEEELARLRATPPGELRADLAYVAGRRAMPSWARYLAEGDREMLDRVAESVHSYHRVAVAPYWRAMSADIAVEQVRRARQLREGGVERVLESLRPGLRRRPPVLEMAGSGAGEDYHLNGRALLLAPAAFCAYLPCDPAEEQPTLYYQAAAHPPPAALAAAPVFRRAWSAGPGAPRFRTGADPRRTRGSRRRWGTVAPPCWRSSRTA
ncbi:ArsR family transcriptional regulator [Streptomyces axinellae]|uniref:Transcriptional regulator n=1 Tax=Streptomyces axinellae TaxID=552788 RepID=A0ABP6C6X0_9ACTN